MIKLLVVMTIMGHVIDGFIMNTYRCAAHSPCTCQGTNVMCSYKQLQTFPGLDFSSIYVKELTIYLQQNRLTSIPANALHNIRFTEAKELDLHLENNMISSVDGNAFVGLGNIITTINLSGNNLTAVPTALAKITHLKSLKLFGNQIAHFDSSITSSIGASLQVLELNMSRFTVWPSQFSDLSAVAELYLEHVPFPSLPKTAFDGLSNLKRLKLYNSKLNMVPEAICSISQLQSIEFMDSDYLLNSITDVFPDCPSQLVDVSSVSLQRNHLRYFPYKVFNLFPKLTSIDLIENNLNTMDINQIPVNCSLYSVYLSSNRFCSIPKAIAIMPLLIKLVMTDNHVTQVGDDIFSGLQNFQELFLSGNPISYVDPSAFNSNHTLRVLYLARSNMTTVPTAVLDSAEYMAVDLLNAPIQCTCPTLAFLKVIPTQDIVKGKKFFRGTCVNTGQYLKDYLVNTLPNCQ